MTDQRSTDDWIAASLEAMDRYEASLEPSASDPSASDPSPRPGDLYVLPATRDYAVEWLVVARESAPDPLLANDFEPSTRVLVMPAESHVLAGSADVEVTSADGSPLVVHCAYGIWIDPALLTPDLRVSRIEPTNLTRVRRRWLELGDGRESDDPVALEVDESTEYLEWIEEVIAPAHRALSRVLASSAPPTPVPAPAASSVADSDPEKGGGGETLSKQSSSHAPFLRIAASILVALASLQLWRLHDRVQDLEVAYQGAEDRYGAKVSELEGERDRLLGERDRLRTRQEELEAAGEAYREEAGKLREQVEELDRRLGEAEEGRDLVNTAFVAFSAPKEATRGKESVAIRDDQAMMMVFLGFSPKDSADRYRLEVRRKRSGELIWESDDLRLESPSEFRIVLPTRRLVPGVYDLEVFASRGSSVESAVTYELTIRSASQM